MTHTNLIPWDQLKHLDGFARWHKRPCALLIGNFLYAIDSPDLAEEVAELPGCWVPLAKVSDEEADELLSVDPYEWDED